MTSLLISSSHPSEYPLQKKGGKWDFFFFSRAQYPEGNNISEAARL